MKATNRYTQGGDDGTVKENVSPDADAARPPVWQARPSPTLPLIACHVEQIPPFTGAVLARLYAQLYASLEYFESFKPRDRVSTLVSQDRAGVNALIVFRTTGARAEVFNQSFALDEAMLQRFVSMIFDRFAEVDMICLRNLVSQPHALLQPYQAHNAAEDYVLQLPSSVEQYTESLGKSTRRNIRRYHAKLLQDHPSFAIRFDVGPAICDGDVASLLAMSEAKIRSKGKTFAVDAGYARAMAGLTRRCGFVAVATVDGKVCAGLICYRIGDGFSAKVVAHEGKYDDYWLGTLCYYFTICEAIRRGGILFNMGSQRYDYKERLLGVHRDLENLTIYRSRWKQLRHADVVLLMVFGQRVRQAKLWIRSRESCKAEGIAGVAGRVLARIAMRLAAAFRAARG
ncbi:MAG: GNAT family N-acetyltransferase [Herminiimonas sp.]|nr:GNAT family N-acetyltransferase [Herminiimonas sp.]